MSKQLLAKYKSITNNKVSELCYDYDWGNYYIYFYDENGELFNTKSCPGHKLMMAEQTAESWMDPDNKSNVICEKYDYLIARARSRMISIRKVLK